jgi:hypothetical protein
MGDIQIMKKLKNEKQIASCHDDGGQESDISVLPKPDTQHPEDTRLNSRMTSSPPPSQDHARFNSILERFWVDQGSPVNSEKGTHICQQEIAKNPGRKSILNKMSSSHYRERV